MQVRAFERYISLKKHFYWSLGAITRLRGWWKKGVCICMYVCMNNNIVYSSRQPIFTGSCKMFLIYLSREE